MLRLNWLQITGFKSFPNRTRVQFGPGITCIVGPNGCGKSNLADAIGWVLGIQTAHSLRGERMEDVIFNGTRERKSSGFAEAALSFSRTDGEPFVLKESELSAEALEVGRKLYRSGESIYSLQQRRCRLKDIPPVLEEAKLGFASYALIAQGKIGWFLSAKAHERRAIIEEAARISGYKSRRRSAELKLEMAQQNLLRVNDIISEVERQLRSLKRQASKARRYRELKEDFRQLQRRKFVLQARSLQQQLQELDRELEELKTREDTSKQQLETKEKSYRAAVQEKESLQAELSGLREQLSDVRLELELAENSIEYHHRQIEATRKSLTTGESEQETIAQSLKKIEDELSRFRSEEVDLEKETDRVEAEIKEHTQEVERYQSEIEETEEEIEQLRAHLVQLSAAAAAFNNVKEQLEQQIDTALSTVERLEKERIEHLQVLEQARSGLSGVDQVLKERTSDLNGLRQKLNQQKAKRTALEKALEEIESETKEVNDELIAQRERLQSLEEIELNRSQYSEDVQNFLKHLGESGILRAGGTLADFVETSPEYERLVEEFLDEELEYILVDSLDEAVRGLPELKTLKGGKCTFLSLSSSNGFASDHSVVDCSRADGVYGTLGNLLHMKPEVRTAFYRALPARAEAIVVSDLDRAVDLSHNYPEHTFITLTGEALTPRGLLSVSTTDQKKFGLLSLKRQKKDLEKRVLRLRKKHEALRRKQEEKKERLEGARADVEEKQALAARLEKEIIAANHQKEQWEREEQRQKEAVRRVEQELEQVGIEQTDRKEKLRRAEKDQQEKKAAQLKTEECLHERRKTLDQLKTEFARVQENSHHLVSHQKVLDERCGSLRRTVERIQEQRASLQARQKAASLAHSHAQVRLKEMESALEALQSELQEHRQQAESLQAILKEKEEAYAGQKEDHPELEKSIEALREQRATLQQRRSHFDVEQARLETQLQSINQQCVEQLHLSLQEAAEDVQADDSNLQAVSEAYLELQHRLDRFGPINMTALQEYQESEERYDFLCSQRQDIEASIADTTRAIQEINRRSRERFREAFEAINTEFNHLFERLFDGGECGMRLLEEEDLLESGIDIYAQPPGKKLQNVTLLSGGEKALTVFALLMALFTYRPSRFCVLDEVDAPLDDANVARFARLVREMSEETQFIVITHNKRTMEIADSILGVTMEEPGISKIVSVRL